MAKRSALRFNRLIAAALLATVAGCGTTVPRLGAPQAGQNLNPPAPPSGGLESQVTAGNGVGQPSDAAAAAGTSASIVAGSTNSGAGASSGGEGTSRVAGSKALAANGNTTIPGRALAPITMGALTAQGAGSYEKSLGFSGVATGDQAAMTQSVVAYINAHGGFAGHQVNVLIYDVNVADALENPNSAYQAACAYFTQDHHVFAVASYLSLLPESFYSCMQQHHVPVDTPDEEFSASFLNQYADTVISQSAPNYTRLMADSVDALWSSGWLTASSKVGVVAFDTAAGHSSVDAGLVPALSQHGLTLTDSFYTSTDSSADSQYQEGVLNFKTAGVDRVFFAVGGEPVYFALAAEQEAYHPYYELSSLEYPGVLEQDLPADQLVGAAGIGFDPYIDLDDAHWPKVNTPGEGRCLSALKAAQQNLSSGTTMAIGAWICDDWFLFQTALVDQQIVTSDSLMRGVDGLGSRFSSASTFATYFASGRRDGPSEYRLNAFQSGCSCFTYQSSQRALP